MNPTLTLQKERLDNIVLIIFLSLISLLIILGFFFIDFVNSNKEPLPVIQNDIPQNTPVVVSV